MRQLKLPLEIEKLIDISDPVYTFCEVMDYIDLSRYFVEKGSKPGRPRCDAQKLIKVILFAFIGKFIQRNAKIDICRSWCFLIRSLFYNPLKQRALLNESFVYSLIHVNVPLCSGNTAMLQELLHKYNIIIILLIYLGRKILPEGMGADRLHISEIINHFFKILLNLALFYGKHLLFRSNVSVITVYSHETVHRDRHSKCSFFLCFLFNDIQAVTSPIHYDVLQMQGEYVLYSHSQISFQ